MKSRTRYRFKLIIVRISLINRDYRDIRRLSFALLLLLLLLLLQVKPEITRYNYIFHKKVDIGFSFHCYVTAHS